MKDSNNSDYLDYLIDSRNGTLILDKGMAVRGTKSKSGISMQKAKIPEIPFNPNDFTIDQLVGVKTPEEQAIDPRYVKKYPYKVNPNYLTVAELKLMQALLKHLDSRVVLGVKSRVADLINMDEKLIDAYSLNKHSVLGAIAQKHIDFTVIDASKGIVICCIELDDVYHLRKDNIQKDMFKDEVFKECGLPLFRIKTKIDELSPKRDFRQIDETILEYFAPACPTCGKQMLLKYDRFGSRFYACVDNQKCRRTIPID